MGRGLAPERGGQHGHGRLQGRHRNEAHATGTRFAAGHVADCVTGRCPEFLHAAKRSINVGAPKKQLFDITRKLTFSISGLGLSPTTRPT